MHIHRYTPFLLALLFLPILQAAPAYKKGELQIETFATQTTADFKKYTGGYGIGLAYAYHDNWTLGLRATHTGFGIQGVAVQDVSARLNARLPFKSVPLAAYTYLGAGYNLATDKFQIQTGAGLEYRFSRHIGIFAEAGPNVDFKGHNTFTGTGGLRLSF